MSASFTSTKQVLTKIIEEVFDNKLRPISQRLDKVDQRLDKVEQRLDKLEAKQAKTLEILSDVMGELKASREDRKLLTEKVYNDHEPRLTKVESKLNLSVA